MPKNLCVQRNGFYQIIDSEGLFGKWGNSDSVNGPGNGENRK